MSGNATKFLSCQGYSITKSAFPESILEDVKKELTVSPHIAGDFANLGQPKSYKLYAEGPTKLYMPKHYGLKRFGTPDVSRVREGKDIDVVFAGNLRPEQEAAVAAYKRAAADETKCGGLLNLTCASGKCLARDTPVLMFDGTTKRIQDVFPGDVLMGDDSTPRKVLSTSVGSGVLYRVNQLGVGGKPYIVNEDHILTLLDTRTREVIDIPLADLILLPREEQCALFGLKANITFSSPMCSSEIPISPFVAGMLCIESCSSSVPTYFKANTHTVMSQFILGVIEKCGQPVSKDKWQLRIPNPSVLRDLQRMLTCCGYASTMKRDGYLYVYKDVEHIYAHMSYPIAIERYGYGLYYGIVIDGNRRFVLGDCTVTHNTVMAINLMCQLRKKTLVIVHKDFLLQQWKERIEQFAPTARIGLIKAQTVDVHDKDVVIGSLQSLSMKKYEDEVFADFGFVVVDEVHHTSAEVFCRALKKVSFKYTLGLSATIKRKDGLSKVFMWYLGDVLYSNVKKTTSDVVHVKCVKFGFRDPVYCEEVHLKARVLNVSRMINNICQYKPRIEQVTDVILETLDNEPERRMIVLSDRRTHLEAMGKMLETKGVDCGYYLGGMKQQDLKESESKRVILGTYQMVSEGFDCKSLDTLILASPKSDVVQSVGRILREEAKNRRHIPLVIDFIDDFSIFAGQAAKRCAYYKKQRYVIHNDEETMVEDVVNGKPAIIKERRIVQLE